MTTHLLTAADVTHRTADVEYLFGRREALLPFPSFLFPNFIARRECPDTCVLAAQICAERAKVIGGQVQGLGFVSVRGPQYISGRRGFEFCDGSLDEFGARLVVRAETFDKGRVTQSERQIKTRGQRLEKEVAGMGVLYQPSAALVIRWRECDASGRKFFDDE